MQCPFAPDFLEASGLASIKGKVAAHAQNATCVGIPGPASGIPARNWTGNTVPLRTATFGSSTQASEKRDSSWGLPGF